VPPFEELIGARPFVAHVCGCAQFALGTPAVRSSHTIRNVPATTRRGTMIKSLALVLPIILAALAATGAQAAQNDKLTGMPVNPDLSYSNPSTQSVCSTQVHLAIYTPRPFYILRRHVSLKTVSAWYASHLRGFTQIHGAISGRPTEAFMNADGTISVQLVANSPQTGVYAATYSRNAKFQTMSNLTTWLAGSAGMCH